MSVDEARARLRRLADRAPFTFPSSEIPPHFRFSAILILFWAEGDDLRTVLTRRASHMSRHAGQVAFPGGMIEDGETSDAAAIRETWEEIGLPPDRIELMGRLDDAWAGTGAHLVPWVGWAEDVSGLVPNPQEVDEILTPSVRELRRPEASTEEVVQVRGVDYLNVTIHFDGGLVHGLSTDLLLEALDFLQGVDASRGPTRLRDLRTYHED